MNLLWSITRIVATPSNAWLDEIREIDLPTWVAIITLVGMFIGGLSKLISIFIPIMKIHVALKEKMKNDVKTNHGNNMINRLFPDKINHDDFFFDGISVKKIGNVCTNNWDIETAIEASFLITGEAGSGKSVLLNYWAQKILQRYNVLLPSSTAFWYFGAGKFLSCMTKHDEREALVNEIITSKVKLPFLLNKSRVRFPN